MNLLLALSTVVFVHYSLGLEKGPGNTEGKNEFQDGLSNSSTCNMTEAEAREAWLRKIHTWNQNAQKDYKVCTDKIKELFYCHDPGPCKKDHGLAVFSYHRKCSKCLGSVKGWILYLFLATFPTTVFFLIVYGCGIKATSAPMNAFVCIIQITLYATSVNTENYKETISGYNNPAYYRKMLHLAFYVFDVFSVWNLDFFRHVLPQFCINRDLKTLHVLAMEYIVAIYPLVCIAALYICIELHDRDYKPLVLLWKPFSWCLAKSYFKNYDPKMSIIEVFATFLLLAYSKLLFTSFNLLAFTTMYSNTSNLSEENFVSSRRMQYDISIPYLGSKHLPFFILAIFVLLIFNILPFLLLLIYPTKLFQKALGCCTRVRWHPLHAFADAFQGCYKNGTNGTKDCRYFAALFLLARASFSITAFFVYTDSQVFTVFTILTCHMFAMLFGTIRPYRDDLYNKWDMLLLFLIPIPQLWFGINENKIAVVSQGIVLAIFMMYYIFIATYKTLSVFAPRRLRQLKHCFGQKTCCELCKPKVNRENAYEEINQNNNDDEVFDRLENPQNYQQLGITNILNGEQNGLPYASYGTIY